MAGRSQLIGSDSTSDRANSTRVPFQILFAVLLLITNDVSSLEQQQQQQQQQKQQQQQHHATPPAIPRTTFKTTAPNHRHLADLKYPLPTSTPHFGGCLGSTELVCALHPDHCPSEAQYILPSNIQLTLCHTPHQIKTGRCGSEKSWDSCAAFPSSCQKNNQWEEFRRHDDTCTLVEDLSSDNDGKLVEYPTCRTLPAVDPTTPSRCVLSNDECISGRETFLPATQSTSPCYCYDVPTGLCYSTSTASSFSDPLASFCAIAAYDCPSTHAFLPAYELSNRSNPPHRCRLCHKENVGVYESHGTVVESGGCFSDDGNFVRCALESTECDGAQTFRASRELRAMGYPVCPADMFPGGECTSLVDEVRCTNKKESCQIRARFVRRDSCSMRKDLLAVDGMPTYFSACREIWGTGGDWRKYRCVWDSSECGAGNVEDFSTATKPLNWFPGCTCEDVETGACQSQEDGASYCAISSLGCAEGDAYVRSLDTAGIGLDCRLCQPLGVVALPTDAPVALPTDAPMMQKVNLQTLTPTTHKHKAFMKTYLEDMESLKRGDDKDDTFDNDDEDNEDSSFALGLILIGSIGGTFLLTSIAVYVYIWNPFPRDEY